MKKHNLIYSTILMLFILAYASLGFADTNTNNTNKNVYTDPAKTILVTSSNPVFSIQLASNATTGYSWFLTKINKKLLTPLGQQYIAPDSKLLGAGGHELWTFKVKPKAFTVPHLTSIKMTYAQPWNLKEGKQVRFNIAIRK